MSLGNLSLVLGADIPAPSGDPEKQVPDQIGAVIGVEEHQYAPVTVSQDQSDASESEEGNKHKIGAVRQDELIRKDDRPDAGSKIEITVSDFARSDATREDGSDPDKEEAMIVYRRYCITWYRLLRTRLQENSRSVKGKLERCARVARMGLGVR